ncbi:MAG: hypothetical protein ABJA62_10820 [Luteimonas sp.]
MNRYAIACYRPKPGRENDLLALVREHQPTLRAEGLAGDGPPWVMRAEDGTVIEVFEWRSLEAKDTAHRNPAVQALWGRMTECAEFPPLSALTETQRPFASFEAIAP